MTMLTNDEIKLDYTYDDIKAMSLADRTVIIEMCEEHMNNGEFGKFYDLYNLVNLVADDEYRDENMNAFREYESHKNEPDFDWDFYSDWHKDMFGFRPRS